MALTVGTSLVLAYLLAWGHRRKCINRVGQLFRVTNRYGDEDVWEYFHNLPADEKRDGWVVVRDHKTGIDYYGNISVWSDAGMEREIVISNASVSRDGDFLYDADLVYLSRTSGDLSIEVPYPKPAEEEEDNGATAKDKSSG